jgi:hypothetical protein
MNNLCSGPFTGMRIPVLSKSMINTEDDFIKITFVTGKRLSYT